MGTMIADDGAAAVTEDFANYRVVSRSAILAAVLVLPALLYVFYGVGTQLGLEALPVLLLLTLPGVVLALVALGTIRRYPSEYAGKPVALLALAAHVVMLLVAIPCHAYVQATEVPDGYHPVSFSELQPDPLKGEFGLPNRAFDLAGKEVFIKGYIHPAVASLGKIDHFILVRDFDTCCFGGQPKPTHMMEVKIVNNAPRLEYSTRLVRLAGKFQVSPPTSPAALEVQNVVYHLEADYVKP